MCRARASAPCCSSRSIGAVADGDIIWGVVRGTALSHGGRTSGYTVPNPVAQGERGRGCHRARRDRAADDITYIEAHGTGTSLGDPIEIDGLSRAFGRPSAGARRACAIGSVKSSIGHLEGAAGIAGVTKVLLQMQHGELAPTLHADRLNPNIDFASVPFDVQRTRAPWYRLRRDGIERPRVAGVSSFGAGGANAHVVIEEHVLAVAPRRSPAGPAIVTLSGRDPARLAAAASNLLDWLNDAGADAWTLHDMAYTLQVGRDAFAERLAFVADDLVQARAALARFLGGETAGLFGSQQGASADAQQRAATAIAAGDPAGLAAAWAAGAVVDWRQWHRDTPLRRIVLPTYPFARERCWIETTAAAVPAAGVVTAPPVRVTLDLDPDDPLVRSHMVGDEAVLPGTATIALALEAAALLWPGRAVAVRDLVWMRRVIVDAAVTVSLSVERDADSARFALDSKAGRHAQGRIGPVSGAAAAEAPWPDQAIGGDAIDGYELYTRLREGGLRYGAAHRGIRSLRVDGDRVEAELVLSAGSTPLARAAWLDACLHGVAALAAAASGLSVPFGLAEARLYDPLPERATVQIMRRDARRYDVVARDVSGRLVALFVGLALRPVAPAVVADARPDPLADMIWIPRWRVEAVAKHERPSGSAVVLASDLDDPLAAALAARYATASIMPFGTAPPDAAAIYLLVPATALNNITGDPVDPGQAMLDLLRELKPLLPRDAAVTVVTRRAAVFGTIDDVDPINAGISGLARAAAREATARLAVIDVNPGDNPAITAALVAQEGAHRNGDMVAIRRGVRYRLWLDAAALPVPAKLPWRHQGHYLLIGGAGGIGFALSRHLARTQSAKLTWIGRRAADPRIAAQIAEIRALGGDAVYIPADATEPAALTAAVGQATRRFGPLHGAFHAALVLRDGMLARMSEADFLAVFDVKARGALALADALRGHELDFLTVFSSAISFTANPGQASYAAGSTFIDAFMQALGRRGAWPIHVINWGFWGTVGAVADPETVRRMAAQGVLSIEPAEGIAAVERIIAAGLARAVPLKLEPKLAARLHMTPDMVMSRLSGAAALACSATSPSRPRLPMRRGCARRAKPSRCSIATGAVVPRRRLRMYCPGPAKPFRSRSCGNASPWRRSATGCLQRCSICWRARRSCGAVTTL